MVATSIAGLSVAGPTTNIGATIVNAEPNATTESVVVDDSDAGPSAIVQVVRPAGPIIGQDILNAKSVILNQNQDKTYNTLSNQIDLLATPVSVDEYAAKLARDINDTKDYLRIEQIETLIKLSSNKKASLNNEIKEQEAELQRIAEEEAEQARIAAEEEARLQAEAQEAQRQAEIAAQEAEQARQAQAVVNTPEPMVVSTPEPAPTPQPTPTPVATPAPASSVEQIIRDAAARHGVDGDYMVYIANCESGLNPNAVNYNYYENGHPSGLFQHISGYYPSRAAQYGYSNNVFDAYSNAGVTAAMFADGQGYYWECR